MELDRGSAGIARGIDDVIAAEHYSSASWCASTTRWRPSRSGPSRPWPWSPRERSSAPSGGQGDPSGHGPRRHGSAGRSPSRPRLGHAEDAAMAPLAGGPYAALKSHHSMGHSPPTHPWLPSARCPSRPHRHRPASTWPAPAPFPCLVPPHRPKPSPTVPGGDPAGRPARPQRMQPDASHDAVTAAFHNHRCHAVSVHLGSALLVWSLTLPPPAWHLDVAANGLGVTAGQRAG